MQFFDGHFFVCSCNRRFHHVSFIVVVVSYSMRKHCFKQLSIKTRAHNNKYMAFIVAAVTHTAFSFALIQHARLLHTDTHIHSTLCMETTEQYANAKRQINSVRKKM